MPDFPLPPHRRPLGRALRRTAAERERLATITPGDVTAARMLWHLTAPRGWEGLIEAKVEPPKDER